MSCWYNDPIVTYDYLSMVKLPRENETIYISLADGNNHHPHDTEYWLSIEKYEEGCVYGTGHVVYFIFSEGIYFSRSCRCVNDTHAANKEHWKFSQNIQDLGILTMVTNTISPPRNSIEKDKDMQFLLDKFHEVFVKDDNIDINVRLNAETNHKIVSYSNEILGPKGYSTNSKEKEIRDGKLKEHPIFLKIKTLYDKAIIVETRKRGHSETSRIKSRWGKELSIIEEFIVTGKKLPPQTDKALDRVHKELLDYVNSAGEWSETTKEYVDISTMIDVMLHPAK